MKPSRLRVNVEISLALIATALALLTMFWRDWIEGLTGWDPDHHNGGAEWLIVAGLFAAAVAAGLLARRHLRQLERSVSRSDLPGSSEQA
jgi:hypothetical protein